MAVPLAEAFVRISLDMRYLQAQQAQAQKMLADFANQKVSRSMTPTDVYNSGFAKAWRDAQSGAVELADAIQVVRQMEAAAVDQAKAMAEGIREANAAADPLVSKMRNLEQFKTLMRGGFLSGEDAAVAARRMNGPTAGEADEKRLATIATQAYESTRTAAERYKQAVENLNAARSKMGEDTYSRAIAAAASEYKRATAAADPFAAIQARINALIEQGTSPLQRYAAAEKQLASEMQKLGYSQQQQQTALSGLRQSFGMTVDSGRRMNSIIQQASFGAQDFITVLSGGGGLQMAMMSAANNAAQMAAISGGMSGAMVGVGVTIGAVVVPAILSLVDTYIKWGEATESVLKKQEQLAEFLERRIPSATEVAAEAGNPARRNQRITDMQTAKEAENELSNQRQDAEARKAEVAKLEKDLQRERQKLSAMEKERRQMGERSTVGSEAFQLLEQAEAQNMTGGYYPSRAIRTAMEQFGIKPPSASDSKTDLEIRDIQNKEREKADKELAEQRRRVEERSVLLGRRKKEEQESAAIRGPALERAIELEEKEMDAANKKYRQRKAKEEKIAREAYKRENLSISGDMNEYESRRIAVQEKFDSRRERLEENRHISEQERNRSLKLAEQARDQDLEKLKRDETHHKNRAIREADRLDSEARNISNPVAAAKARIEAEYREKRERLDENKFISEEKRKQIKANLDKAEAYEKSRAGFSPQMVGLQALHSEIQKSLYKSAGDKAAESTAQNTGKIAGDAKRSADALEKMAAAGNSGSAHYAE